MAYPGDRDVAAAAAALASRIPDPLRPLAKLAYNYAWSWTPPGRELFARIDAHRWEGCEENPVRLLQEADAMALFEAAADTALTAAAAGLLDAVRRTPDPRDEGFSPEAPVAFLCTEFAVHRSLPGYAGGLGVLAGDILKEASDRGLPMVGVGLLYRQGYFHQRLDTSGWQHEYWIATDPERLPAALVRDDAGHPVRIEVPVWDRIVRAQIWRVDVGRVPLYLLDVDLPENGAIERWIAARLYTSDRRYRLAQYLLLGIGGIRALRAMGIEPCVVHLNEGHVAFATLELALESIRAGAGVSEAFERARSRTIFTTHTPVAAGNESFPVPQLLDTIASASSELGDPTPLLRLGRVRPDDTGEPFGLTPYALRTSRSANGVSRLHGRISREMWQGVYPGRPPEEVPIGHVTNGVHIPTWMSAQMRDLLDRHLPEGWIERASDPAVWAAVADIPDSDLWSVRCSLRADLAAFVRTRALRERLARGEDVTYAEAVGRFDPHLLTVGFARRATAYKRMYLLVHDAGRAISLLEGRHPIQVLFAGKPHPQDEEAKGIVQTMFTLKEAPAVAGRVAYLENYELGLAAMLVSGCDVWVNVPRPPLEASGTSGMKIAVNGGLNLSVLDGWWDEAHDGTNGWAISSSPDGGPQEQDARDAAALYELLEKDVVPLFYDRGPDGVPRGWIARVKSSLRTNGPRFSSTRMLDEYVARAYAPN